MFLLLALLLQHVAADSYGAVVQAGGCVNKVGCAGFFAAISATTSPSGSSFGPPSNVEGVSVQAIGAQADTNGTTTNAHVDVRGMKINTPADVSVAGNPQLQFYYGYLGASGTWDVSTAAGSVTGAFLEILSTVAAIAAYHDRDGVDGFQWDLTSSAEVFTCATAPAKVDCVEFGTILKVGSGLSFGAITKTEIPCANVTSASAYGPNCRIIELSVSATLPAGINVSTAAVITVVARTATQPIMINGLLHSPLKLKWDVIINPPWGSWTVLDQTTKPRIVVLFFHAGKAGVGVASNVGLGGQAAAAGAGAQVSGSHSLTFTQSKGYAAYFGYVDWATTDTVSGNTTVYTQIITYGDLQAYSGTGIITNSLVGLFKGAANVSATFGWTFQLTFHSFVADQPNSIHWDPEVGQDTTASTDNTSLSFALVPSVFLALLSLLW